MTLNPEQAEITQPREIVFNDYGIYIVTDQDAYPLTNEGQELDNPKNVVLVSQPDWKSTLHVLEGGSFGKTTVLTPELITIAGDSFTGLYTRRDEIERALERISKISQNQPDTTFIIGSPHFVEGHTLPFNAAIAFKDGQVTQASHKKLLGGNELGTFDFDPRDEPIALEDSTLLICRDLIGAQKTRLRGGKSGVFDYVKQTSNDTALAERFAGAEFIAPGSKRILLESCWGVGMPIGSRFEHSQQNIIDQYYLMNLRGNSQSILRIDPDINQVIVCDRAPMHVAGELVSSKPMSAVFFK